MTDYTSIYDCGVVLSHALQFIISGLFNCHILPNIIVFCLAVTCSIVEYRNLLLAREVMERNWWLVSAWALSMTWFLISHCLRLRRPEFLGRFRLQRAPTYLASVVMSGMLTVALQICAFEIQKGIAERPMRYTLGDTLRLTFPVLLTGLALWYSIPDNVDHDAPPGAGTELHEQE